MMKIIGVIPARYASTRFPGKPLADICGKPMIWGNVEKVLQKTPEYGILSAKTKEKKDEMPSL